MSLDPEQYGFCMGSNHFHFLIRTSCILFSPAAHTGPFAIKIFNSSGCDENLTIPTAMETSEFEMISDGSLSLNLSNISIVSRTWLNQNRDLWKKSRAKTKLC